MSYGSQNAPSIDVFAPRPARREGVGKEPAGELRPVEVLKAGGPTPAAVYVTIVMEDEAGARWEFDAATMVRGLRPTKGTVKVVREA